MERAEAFFSRNFKTMNNLVFLSNLWKRGTFICFDSLEEIIHLKLGLMQLLNGGISSLGFCWCELAVYALNVIPLSLCCRGSALSTHEANHWIRGHLSCVRRTLNLVGATERTHRTYERYRTNGAHLTQQPQQVSVLPDDNRCACCSLWVIGAELSY